jgi:hypothetical protein
MHNQHIQGSVYKKLHPQEGVNSTLDALPKLPKLQEQKGNKLNPQDVTNDDMSYKKRTQNKNEIVYQRILERKKRMV